MIYLDNPATSWPKPSCMLEAMQKFSETAGGNPGRSGHRLSTEAGRIVFLARDSIASMFGLKDADRVVFTMNATMALNTAIFSILKPGDIVLTTSCEHNSVMRPLRNLESKGVEVLICHCMKDGSLDTTDFVRKLARHPKLVVAAHASNVTGQIMPIENMAVSVKEKGALFLLDAAQTAGTMDLSRLTSVVDMIAFPGHKGLLGPQGTGGLIVCTDEAESSLRPIMHGGTGSRSAFENQPEELPDRLESGTLNGIGIAGLGASIGWILEQGIQTVSDKLDILNRKLTEGLSQIDGVEIYGPVEGQIRSHLVSFNVSSISPSEVGRRLDENYGILGRVGLHCSPSAHKTLDTFPNGTVRFGAGPFTMERDIEITIDSVKEIAKSGR